MRGTDGVRERERGGGRGVTQREKQGRFTCHPTPVQSPDVMTSC